MSLAGTSSSSNNKEGGGSSSNGTGSGPSSNLNQPNTIHLLQGDEGSLSDYANRYPFIKQENFTIEPSEDEDKTNDDGSAVFKPVDGDRESLLKEASKAVDLFDYERATVIALSLLSRDYDDADAHAIILDTFNELGFRNQLVMDTRDVMRDIMLNAEH